MNSKIILCIISTFIGGEKYQVTKILSVRDTNGVQISIQSSPPLASKPQKQPTVVSPWAAWPHTTGGRAPPNSPDPPSDPTWKMVGDQAKQKKVSKKLPPTLPSVPPTPASGISNPWVKPPHTWRASAAASASATASSSATTSAIGSERRRSKPIGIPVQTGGFRFSQFRTTIEELKKQGREERPNIQPFDWEDFLEEQDAEDAED